MMKILGIDTGTNSLGWAIVQKDDNGMYSLMEHGVNIFQEGVKIEKGIESSKASERTGFRSVRKHYWRRKVRKIRLLTILSEANLCPPLAKNALRLWRNKKIYPTDKYFIEWQRTDEDKNINPYYYRYRCLTEKLNLNDISHRYILGRALYHLNQRRGFLSNRKENTKESDGKVSQDISQLSQDMVANGCHYLGEYFYKLYQSGEKIRSHYTSRNEHYLAEFNAICSKQQLESDLVELLIKAIFSQRPLKSQKQFVGKCTFEPKKARCSASHPLYEEYRMYAFLNNVKIKTPIDFDLRPLLQEEREAIIPLFMRKSKRTFPFEDIAKKLSNGKNSYCYAGDREQKPYVFNYNLDTLVSGCPVTAQLQDVFGENWVDSVGELYALSQNKSRTELINDIWHVLFFFDDEEKLKLFAKNRLQLDEESATKFSKIVLPQDYASLSLKAIKKILPYLRNGMIYSEAVFMANLDGAVPACLWDNLEMRKSIIADVLDAMHTSDNEGLTIEQRIKRVLKERYYLDNCELKKLYHPSMIELYPRQQRNEQGIFQLGSPRINSVRNPMAMHSLFRLRKVINQLLAERKIDEDTIIHIEFSRDLNDANRRKAIQQWNRDNEKKREAYRKSILELYRESGIAKEPSYTDILKYQLWEEQGHQCIYTTDQISCSDFLGPNPKYDIEHTIPRSAGGDSTAMNLTLCQNRFNREVKKAMLPSQLSNHEDILQRVEPWKEKYEALDRQIRKLKGSNAATKEEKDKIICRRHFLTLQRDYWRGKYQRFVMTEVPEGFSRRQGTDISVISRYARLFLRTIFRKVYVVKGIATSDFRKIWGIQEEYEKKSRENHIHHCIDAVTIACIGIDEYGKLAHYYHLLEESEKHGKDRPRFDLPWPTFVTDMKHLQDELLIAHYTQDNIRKSARRRIQTPEGKVLAKGDVARVKLHNETYYGAIECDGEVRYVVRKPLDSIDDKNISNIIDNEVRQKIEAAVAKYGDLKKAVEADDVWMNKEKGIRIKKVRVFAPNIARPINMRKQRDLSTHEYKQEYHVQNDRNYLMAIYGGKDNKGRNKREFEMVNNMTAVSFYSNNKKNGLPLTTLVPTKSESGYDLKFTLKIGSMVLLYEKSSDEVWALDNVGLQKRLYKVTGLSSMDVGRIYGTIELTHHQEARPKKEVKSKNGAFKSGEPFRSCIIMLHTQFNALVEGVDFSMNDIGEIRRLK